MTPAKLHQIGLAVKLLNEATEADPDAMKALVESRVPVNDKILAHPTIQVWGYPPEVGLLGILNGIFGADPQSGSGYIAAVMCSNTGKLLCFEANIPGITS